MTDEKQFARAKAIAVLECMAIDLTGALAESSKTNPMTEVLEQRLEAIDTAQAALREQESAKNAHCNSCKKRNSWISVEERLPEPGEKVLVFSLFDGINIGWLQPVGRRFSVKTACPDRPTHWMPLPEPPEVEG